MNRTAAQEDASTTERGEPGRIRPEAVTTPGDLKGTESHCQDCHYVTYIPFKCYSHLSKKKGKRAKGWDFPVALASDGPELGLPLPASCAVSTLQRFWITVACSLIPCLLGRASLGCSGVSFKEAQTGGKDVHIASQHYHSAGREM